MIRNLKTLAVALGVIFAMSAVAASAAPAEIFAFSSEAESTSLKGAQIGTSKMTVDAGTLSCEASSFTGEMPSEAFDVVLTPTYSGCLFAGVPVEIKTNGCVYVMTTATKEGSNYEVETGIECEEGKSITATAKLFGVTKCTIDIGPQAGLKKITVTETGSPTELHTSIALSGIKYSQTAGTGLGACAKAEGTTNGTYEGTAVIEAFAGETQKKLEAEPLPQTIDLSKGTLQFTGKGTKVTFDIINLVNEAVTILAFIHKEHVDPQDKCIKKSLAKKGDKCTEELVCDAPVKQTRYFGITTGPPGGARAKVEGC